MMFRGAVPAYPNLIARNYCIGIIALLISLAGVAWLAGETGVTSFWRRDEIDRLKELEKQIETLDETEGEKGDTGPPGPPGPNVPVCELEDVDCGEGPGDCDFLKFNETTNKWETNNITYEVIQGEICPVLEDGASIDCMSDVNITDVQDCDVLKFNETTGVFENVPFAEIINMTVKVCELQDTDCNEGPGDCEFLKFNETTNNWETQNITYEVIQGEICPVLEAGAFLDCMMDVSTTGASDDDYLCFNGTDWVPKPIEFDEIEGEICPILEENAELDCMSNVEVSEASENEYLCFNGTKWVPRPIDLIIDGNLCPIMNAGVELDCLSDVNITNPSDDEYLCFNGSVWISETIKYEKIEGEICPVLEANASLDCMSDVNVMNATEDEYLCFNGTSWVPRSIELIIDGNLCPIMNAGVELDCLSDVNITNPSDDEYLCFNGTSWTSETIKYEKIEGEICPVLQANASLDCMSDVNVTDANEDEYLCFNGTTWVPRPIELIIDGNLCPIMNAGVELDCLSDVNISNPSDDEYLCFNGSTWTSETIKYEKIEGEICPVLQANASLDCMSDVEVANATEDEYLCFNGTSWVPRPIELIIDGNLCPIMNAGVELDCLSDVNISNPSDDEYLCFNGSTWISETIKYEKIDGDICPVLQNASIDCMSDVNITDVQDCDILKFNDTTGVFENVPFAEIINMTVDICELKDVNCEGGPGDCEFLKFNETTNNWETNNITYEVIQGEICPILEDGAELDCMSDVNVTNANEDEYLCFNGTTWVPRPIELIIDGNLCPIMNAGVELDCLSDVNITDVQDCDIIKYNSTSGVFENTPLNAVINITVDVCDLDDADCGDGPGDCEFLKFNETTNNWESNNITYEVIQGEICPALEDGAELDCMSDVNITDVQDCDILKFNETTGVFENVPFAEIINMTVDICELKDVNCDEGPGDCEFLKFNETTNNWETNNITYEVIQGDMCAALTDNSVSIDCLIDVEVDDPQDCDILHYNSSKGVFENVPFPVVDNDTCDDCPIENTTSTCSNDPPCNCTEDENCAGRFFLSAEDHTMYVCDCGNVGRWRGLSEFERFGEEKKPCNKGEDLLEHKDCNVDWGDAVGASDDDNGPPESGLFVPQPFVITRAGFASFEKSCTEGGSFDVVICWSTDNDTITYAQDRCEIIFSGLSDTKVANSNDLDIVIPGNVYVTWGIDNNCEDDGDGNGEDCAECKGGVTNMTLRYDGGSAAVITVEDSEDTYFNGTVQPNATFAFGGTKSDGKFQKKELEVLIDGIVDTTIHVSCSQEVGPGTVFGDFTVVEAISKDNGNVCPVEDRKRRGLFNRLFGDDDETTRSVRPRGHNDNKKSRVEKWNVNYYYRWTLPNE